MISWMIAILFMPFIAAPLYFIIGTRKRESKYKKEYVSFHEKSIDNPYVLKNTNNEFQNLLEKNGIPPATSGNSYKLISDDVEAYETMIQEIENAKHSIDICTYVFEFDETTKVILEALTKKAKEGVRVRLLMDLIGSLGASFSRKGFKELKNAGGEVAFFIPILKRPFQNYINLRNHRKIVTNHPL